MSLETLVTTTQFIWQLFTQQWPKRHSVQFRRYTTTTEFINRNNFFAHKTIRNCKSAIVCLLGGFFNEITTRSSVNRKEPRRSPRWTKHRSLTLESDRKRKRMRVARGVSSFSRNQPGTKQNIPPPSLSLWRDSLSPISHLLSPHFSLSEREFYETQRPWKSPTFFILPST